VYRALISCCYRKHLLIAWLSVSLWATVCKTVRPMLSNRCLFVLSVCPVCNVGALRPNGWTDQDETWYGGRTRPWPHCVTWRPSSPSPNGHIPNFRPMSVVAKRLDGSICHLVRRKASAPTTLCEMGTQLSPPRNGHSSPHFSAHVYCGQTIGWIKMSLSTEIGLGPGYIVLHGDPATPER